MNPPDDLLPRFRDCPVLVVGDLMLDEFVWGVVARISPEAPVPVVQITRRSAAPGGAANTAANVSALGGRATVAGVVGADVAGEQMTTLLTEAGVEARGVVRDALRATTTKTRVIAHNQQVVRIDQESPGEPSESSCAELLSRLAEVVPTVRACVVSDYGKGVVSAAVVGRLIQLCRAAGVPIVIDPKGTDYAKYRGATVVKPNQLEAGKALNRDLKTDADVATAGSELKQVLGPDTAVLVTRGAAGMTLFEPGRDAVHIPAQAREVYDVTGAGDTVAGVLALALGTGGELATACRLAGLAAAVVVGKVGTATCTLDELKAARQVAR